MGTVQPLRPPSIITRLADGYQNLMSRLGTGHDRTAYGGYRVDLMSQADIETAYRSSWLTRKVHDLVPFEMTRAGRDWQADKPQIEALEAEETRLGVWPKLCSALTTAGLHGGAAIIMGVVGAGSPDTPLRPGSVRKGALRYLYVASRHALHVPFGFDTDPESDHFGGPAMWQLRGAKGNAVNIHPSRVITFHGAPLPPGSISVSEIDRFWGDPKLLAVKSAIDNAESSQAAVATLLHEMKQDVISIPGLTEQIATEGGEQRLANRINAVGTFKSMFNVLLLDAGKGAEDPGETWETRQLSFAQMPELLEQFIGIVAGAVDIPKTRLMGASPGGMQSTGKGEQDDFNRMIGARQAFELAPMLAKLDEVLIPATLGSRPADIYSVFAPLSEADPKEAAEIEKLEADTVEVLTRTNHIPSAALAKALVNRMTESGRWPGLDVSEQELDANADETEEKAAAALQAANENSVQEMEQRKQITGDQALTLLSDAAPRSLYVSRKLQNTAELAAWAKAQGVTLDDDLHVTLAYSRNAVDWIAAGGDMWGSESDGTLRVAPGGPRLVERMGDGAVALLFSSSALMYRHEEIKRAGASHDYPDYQPHVTLTYGTVDLAAIEPYRGALVFGPEIFEELS